MGNKYLPLFKPAKIGNMQLKNKLVMCPMGSMYAEADGRYSQTHMNYYRERAKGGVGLIIIEGSFISRAEGTTNGVPYLDDDKYLSRMLELTDNVHAYGAKIAVEIGCGFGRIAAPLSSSAVPTVYDPNVICQPLSKEQIKEIVDNFEKAAARCKATGFDAIEVHAHCGYLIDQFMTAAWNTRTDEYGGSLENRVRLPIEIVEAIHRGAGEDFPVLFRMSADHLFEGGRHLEESIEIAKVLEKNGVAALDIDAGSYETIDWIFPSFYHGDACMRELAAKVKKEVSIPVLNTGNYTPDTAVDAIVSGDIDFVMIGRGLIADPQWPNKLAHNTPDEIRPCMRCTEHCVMNMYAGKGISCSVNAQAGREGDFPLRKTDCPKTVAVIGGGPGGMEAARVAAEKGHKVTLFEAHDYLGGQLTAAATAPFKTLRKLLDWQERQIKKLGVDIRMNTEITPESPELEAFDEIIVSVGSDPLKLKIPGIDGEHVVNVIDASLNESKVHGDNIIVMGGGLSGVDYGIELAMKGKNVTIVEMKPKVGSDAPMVRMPALNRTLQENNVKVMVNTRVKEISGSTVTVVDAEGTESALNGNTIIDALGMRPKKEFAQSFLEKYPFARIIGDCDHVGKSGDAIRSGFYAGFAIE